MFRNALIPIITVSLERAQQQACCILIYIFIGVCYNICDTAYGRTRYPSMVFMLCCNDPKRENGLAAKAEKMRQLCEENGWEPISMKHDWVTIFGAGVSKKQGESCPSCPPKLQHESSIMREGGFYHEQCEMEAFPVLRTDAGTAAARLYGHGQ
ncbi:MAG: hypothetical protein ACI4MJ_02730 [Aristaeellaceae bacterium]